ncbi:predicted protein [Naegleria gruberi]|uniref:Predicted protein n=1 Tax=Naegleria gruberi TaxID=5762 RepID=D2W2R1_NAEGR|nr:uncharacterized protein NAEGRDRAFT_82167 [Naegleria gruberi]EFC36690.1 predicted protein [Naegleria gruberi]|eukprot:XP_002669434.1 predicted protein [Naegleria gruberi strain NEG-M]
MVYSSSKVVPASIRQSIENPLNLSTNSKNTYALRYSVVTAVNQKSFSGLKQNVEEVSNADSDGSLAENVKNEKTVSCFRSVKFFIISMITILVVLSALIISATWLSSFGPAITSLSSTIRKNEFESVRSYIEKTVQEIVLVVNTAKSQIHEDDLDHPDKLELSMFKFYKSEFETHDALPSAILIGNQTGSISIINWGTIPAFVDIGTSYQKVYYCLAGLTVDYCKRSVTPNMIMPSFELSGLYATAKSNPDNSLFTPSYNVGADLTFVTMMTSWLKSNSTTEISKYLAFSMELKRISKFLEDLVSSIARSTAFIIETKTDYLIAVNNRTISLAYLAENKVDVIRRTGLTVLSEEHNKLAKEMYRNYPNLKELKCDTLYQISTLNEYITVYRFCSKYNLDWVIAMSTPQWNYISPIIIALLAALGGSIVIIGVSVLVGVAFSFRIVKPFKTLMTMFERVANMDIDAALQDQESKSYFSELNYVQTQFAAMLKKLKMYRAFIPSYLLAELDGQSDETGKQQQAASSALHQSINRSRILTSGNFKSGLFSSIDMIKSQKSNSSKKGQNSMFSLYLEGKQVTFLGILLDGLDQWYKTEDCKSVVNLLSLVYEQINVQSRSSGFNIGAFENDIIILSFNTTKDSQNHVEKALSTVKVLQEKLLAVRKNLVSNSFSSHSSKKSEKVSHQLAENLQFRFAITTQRVYCGNLGTSESKNFSIISSAKVNLEKLLETAHRLDLQVVIPERIFETASKTYQTRFVDMKMLAADQFYQNSIFVKTDSLIDIHSIEDSVITNDIAGQEAIYELGSSNKVSEDEWMYELQQKNQLLKWKKYQDACLEYFSEHYENALKLFEEFMAESSNKETAESLKDSANAPQLEPPLDRPALMLVANSGMVPHNAITGFQNDGAGVVYVAVAHSQWGNIPGKANASGTAWFPYGGQEQVTNNFSYVVNGTTYKHSGDSPAQSVATGYQNDGAGTLWSAIAHTSHGDIPGKAKGNTCWYPYGGKEETTQNFSYVFHF